MQGTLEDSLANSCSSNIVTHKRGSFLASVLLYLSVWTHNAGGMLGGGGMLGDPRIPKPCVDMVSLEACWARPSPDYCASHLTRMILTRLLDSSPNYRARRPTTGLCHLTK